MLLISPENMAAFGIELSFSVRNVNLYSGSDGLRVSIHSLDTDGAVLSQVGDTEPLYNVTSFDFTKRCHINYRFEKLQRYRIIIHTLNFCTQAVMGCLGQCDFDLGIVFARGGFLSLPIYNTASTIEIVAHIPDYYSHFIRLKFRGCHIHPSDGMATALYIILSIPIGDRTIMLYKSELVKNTHNPNWSDFLVPLFLLNFYNEFSINIHCYNHIGNHDDQLVGMCSTTLTQLQRGIGAFNSYMLVQPNGARINEKTCIELSSIQLETGPTFFGMLKDRMNLHLTEAIDLTASNGNPVNDTSLHFIHPHRPSPYLKSILTVTPPLLPYLPNPENPVLGALGFGANFNNQLSHCFFLNGSTTDNRVTGLVGLIDAYRKATMTVQPFAPTDFSEVIYHISTFAKAESRRKLGIYFVLIIMSDGGPPNNTAMKRTIDSIVDASAHPMSIVAIGVGKDRDFTPMRTLEKLTLKHSDGRPLVRQNYTFIESSDLENSDALSMIPLQMVQWKSLSQK